MQIDDEIRLELTAMAHGGAALGRHEGRVVFVRHGIPGETVLVQVTGFGPRERFAEARILEVLEPSADRREHPWAAADALRTLEPVGGMDYGHLRPEAQRRLKTEILREQLVRLGGLEPEHPALTDLAVLPVRSEEGTEGGSGWRTRVHFAVDRQGRLGMHPQGSEDVVPVEDFPLATDAINALRLWEGDWRGAQRVDVAAPADGSEPLVTFTADAEHDDPEALAELAERVDAELDACLPLDREVSAMVLPAPRGGRARGTRPQPVLVRGRDHVVETLPVPDAARPDAPQPLRFRVGAGGFWQIHRDAPAVLAQRLVEAADLRPGDTVWDLYAGAGLFSAVAADRVGAQGTVWSVEGSPVTSGDARANLATDGPARTEGSRGATVHVQRSEVQRALTGRSRTGAPDVVVLDPPRQGAGRGVVQAIHAADPRRIVYVACDPAALGRDAGYLRERGWDLESVTGLDLYPDTHHLEALAVFARV